MTSSQHHNSLRSGDRVNLWLGEWFVEHSVPVTIERLCPKRSRVRTLRRACLPGRGWSDAGTMLHVPTDCLLEVAP
jgi:hypothetical protein